MNSTQHNGVQPRMEIPTYFLRSLLFSAFCPFPPSTILFLVAAGKCNAIYEHYYAGRIAEARKQSKMAKKCIDIGLWLLLGAFIAAVVCIILIGIYR